MKKELFSVLFMVLSFQALHAQGTWTKIDTLPGIGKHGVVSFSIGNKGYVGTGYNNPSKVVYNDFYEYDPATGKWTQKANFGGTARGWGIGFSIGTKGYIGIGMTK